MPSFALKVNFSRKNEESSHPLERDPVPRVPTLGGALQREKMICGSLHASFIHWLEVTVLTWIETCS